MEVIEVGNVSVSRVKHNSIDRSKIGSIGVKDLKVGSWRYLSDKEVKSLLDNLQ